MRSACLRAWLALSMGWAIGNSSPVFATLMDPNFDFENPSMSDPDVSLSMPRWHEMEDGAQQSMPGPNSSAGIVSPLAPHPMGTDGHNWGFIQLANTASATGAFYQSLGELQPLTTYRITFDVSNIDSVNLGIFNPVDVRDVDTTVRVFFTLDDSGPAWGEHVGAFFQRSRG